MVSRPMTWDELVEVITHQNQEIVKLRNVVDAARETVCDFNRDYTERRYCVDCELYPCNLCGLWQALAELDKEGTVER